MSNWVGVVTNAGKALLEQWAASAATLNIENATVGTGTISEADLRIATSVSQEVTSVAVVSQSRTDSGARFRVQVTPLDDEYNMRQIGIWGRVGTGSRTLLALYQNEDGIIIPAKSVSPNFVFSLYCGIAMTHDGDVRLITDEGAYVTLDTFNNVLGSLNNLSLSAGPNSIVQIRKGSYDAPIMGMVIYGKSMQDGAPTPDAPADIVTAGSSGTLPMVSTGKNLIPFTYGTPQVIKSVHFTPNPDGTVNVSGINPSTYTASEFNLFSSSTSGFLPNGTYTVSGLPTEGTGLGVCGMTVETGPKNGSTVYYTHLQAGGHTFVCTDSRTIKSIYIAISPNTRVNAVYAPMLNVGTSVEEYSAPVGITSDIPTPNGLPGIPVDSGGNYTGTDGQEWLCDTIDLEAGVWVKRCGIVSYDGQSASGWERVNAANSKYRFRNTTLTSVILNAATNDAVVPLLCTHYTRTSANATWTNNNVNGIAVDNGGGMFIADAALCDSGTLEQFLARFQTSPMIVVYPLAAPVVTQLTEAQIAALRALRGRKGLTNLYSADPAGPEFRAEMYVGIDSSLDITTDDNTLVFSVSE